MGRKIHNGRGRGQINFNVEKVKDVVTRVKPACVHKDQSLTRYSTLRKVEIAIQQLPTLDEYRSATPEWCQACRSYYIKTSTPSAANEKTCTHVQ